MILLEPAKPPVEYDNEDERKAFFSERGRRTRPEKKEAGGRGLQAPASARSNFGRGTKCELAAIAANSGKLVQQE